MNYSPLRYPGGKSKLVPYVREILRINNLEGGTYVEPFAGGAAIAWDLLLNGLVSDVYINDLNNSIYSFWYSVLNYSDALCQKIYEVSVTVDEWHNQREIYKSEDVSILDKGFSVFFLNRTNRSGILNGGVIGGLKQNGNYKVDCRFNKDDLIVKIENISKYKDRIFLTNLDAANFIDEELPFVGCKCLVNIDPPYYVNGKKLYQNYFIHDDHYRLFCSVKNIKQQWIVTYDDTPEINDIYSEYRPKSFGLNYSANIKRRGSELIIHKPTLIPCDFPPDTSYAALNALKKFSPDLKQMKM